MCQLQVLVTKTKTFNNHVLSVQVERRELEFQITTLIGIITLFSFSKDYVHLTLMVVTPSRLILNFNYGVTTSIDGNFQGDRFGGALDGAARQFTEAYDGGLIPMEFVNSMRKKGQLIMGIGHRVKSVSSSFCLTFIVSPTIPI